MSTFNILQYTDKLDIQSDNESWLSCLCPVCQQKNFKINTTTGAYKCYTTECKPRDIRNKLQKWSPFVAVNVHKAVLPQRMYLKVEPLYIPDDILLSMADSFVRCDRQEDPERRYYEYNLYQQTVRFTTKDGKKVVAPQYLKGMDYVSGIGSMPWSLFNEQHIYDPHIAGQWLCMAEGEKCAVAVTQDIGGYECLTPAGFCWTDSYLTSSMERLKQRDIKGILYFKDNDLPGDKKASIVANAAWRTGLQCTIINPAFCIPDAPQGYDIADCKYEIEDLVAMWVENGR